MATEVASPAEDGRKLRHKERLLYTEDGPDEEEIENTRGYSIEDKLNSPLFDNEHVKVVEKNSLDVKFFQENGFSTPILVKSRASLGIKVPDPSFSVEDIRRLVGGRRILDVMDVSIQKDFTMTLKEWCRYWEEKPRKRILNVISLEFSHTRLESLIESPTIVRALDWVDWVWPKHLKESQTESTNAIDDMKYPKVQKYVLMSVEGCFTDFHIDFGGTSVWYHIVKGRKVFWLIEPTEENVSMFEDWVLSGKQSQIFFGDLVEKCTRVYLKAGDTFFIPSGFIHCVYTPSDSLVFGGNFLHSFAMDKQLRVAQAEDTTKVPAKFRYPFYIEMHWYALERYVHCLTGKSHLSCGEDGKSIADGETQKPPLSPKSTSNGTNSESKCKSSQESQNSASKTHVHLTQSEVNGLQRTIEWLSSLPNHKRNVPELIINADDLLKDAQALVKDHLNDVSSLATTGKLALTWKMKAKNSSESSNQPPQPSGLSLTAQLRLMKPGLYPNLASKSSVNRSINNVNGNSERFDSKKPLDPFSRSINTTVNCGSTVYAVKPSTILNEMPSSFNELIAATHVAKTPLSVNASSMPPLARPSQLAAPISSSSHSSTSTTMPPVNPNAPQSALPTATDSVEKTASTASAIANALARVSSQTKCSIPMKSSNSSEGFGNVSHVNHRPVSSKQSTALNIISDKAIQPMPLSMATSSIPTTIMTCSSATSIHSKGNLASVNKLPPKSTSESSRRRRTRCKKCPACTRADCGECHFCKDMKKFGGPGRMKQSCIARQCMSPVLPHTACCMICGRDGWEKLTTMSGTLDENQSSLMECSQCWEIVHPVCLKEKHPSINLDLGKRDDLPNSWECPKCVGAMKSAGGLNVSSNATNSVTASHCPAVNNAKSRPSHHTVPKGSTEIKCQPAVAVLSVKKDCNKIAAARDGASLALPARKKIKLSEGAALKEGNLRQSISSENKDTPAPLSKSSKEMPFKSQTHPHNEQRVKASFVKSCSRFSSHNEDECSRNVEKEIKSPKSKSDVSAVKCASKQQQDSLSNVKQNSQLHPQTSDSVHKKTKKSNKSTGDSLKDRLFRSLKGLKKSSDPPKASSGTFSSSSSSPSAVSAGLSSFTAKMLSSSSTCSPPSSPPSSPSHSSSSSFITSGSSVLSSKLKSEPLDGCSNGAETKYDSVASQVNMDDSTDSEIDEGITMDEIADSDSNNVSSLDSCTASSDKFIRSGGKENNSHNQSRIGLCGKPLIKPKFVVRPIPPADEVSESEEDDAEDSSDDSSETDEDPERTKEIRKRLRKLRRVKKTNLALEKDVIHPVMRFLDRRDIFSCQLVSRDWYNWSCDPAFWKTINLSTRLITPATLTSLLYKQPEYLDLSWTNICRKQLDWLLPRIPQMKELKLSGCSGSVVTSLCSSNCPLLRSLDISWIDSVEDEVIRDLTDSPTDKRPGLLENKSRLRLLRSLNLAGSDITEAAISLITTHFPHLDTLDLSNCQLLTDLSIKYVVETYRNQLKSLHLSSCDLLTENVFPLLATCPHLTTLDLRNCFGISSEAFTNFFSKHSTSVRISMTQDRLFEQSN